MRHIKRLAYGVAALLILFSPIIIPLALLFATEWLVKMYGDVAYWAVGTVFALLFLLLMAYVLGDMLVIDDQPVSAKKPKPQRVDWLGNPDK